MNDKIVKYIAKPDTWFDAGTEAILVDDYRIDSSPMDAGLFLGKVDGEWDEEVCQFDEFEIVVQ